MRIPVIRNLLALILAAGAVACSETAEKATNAAAVAPPARVVAYDHFESPGGKFDVDFPVTWKGSYRAVDHADTTGGARFGVEFIFKPDAGSKAPPRTLAVIRIFRRDAWNTIASQAGAPIAAKLLTKGEDVYALSLPKGNPYKPGTPEAARFDEMVLAIVDTPPKITPR
jgi:hypothetical protein